MQCIYHVRMYSFIRSTDEAEHMCSPKKDELPSLSDNAVTTCTLEMEDSEQRYMYVHVETTYNDVAVWYYVLPRFSCTCMMFAVYYVDLLRK